MPDRNERIERVYLPANQDAWGPEQWRWAFRLGQLARASADMVTTAFWDEDMDLYRDEREFWQESYDHVWYQQNSAAAEHASPSELAL